MLSIASPLRHNDVSDLAAFVPNEVGTIVNHQTDIPRIAKDPQLTRLIEASLGRVPTTHDLYLGDSREIPLLQPESVHLVLTSPPYWTLKRYRESTDQLGHIADYNDFLDELDKVWQKSFAALAPGGRLICVVGDVCLSRRKNAGRHMVMPLHASIQERCRAIGYDNLAPIIWYKIANASYEVENGSSFLGKPYEPNAVIKNDIEFILMQRKPGGYRKPDLAKRILSIIPTAKYQQWFQQIWSDIPGASTANHPAPFPRQLAERLIRMFSFVGDTVLDPFMGTGTTNIAAALTGRNSIGIEVTDDYFAYAATNLSVETQSLFSTAAQIHLHKK
ncbi:MAG: DNA-methyltransferase [Acidobacteriota bacterium]